MSLSSDENERRAIALFLSTRTEEAFCSLFDAFYARLCQYFMARGVERTSAEELSENVMFQVYRHASALRDGLSFHAWLFQIARNEWLQMRRRRATEPATVSYEPLAGYLSNKLASGDRADGASGSFEEWMRHLDETEREILTLRFIGDLDYPEIAQVLGIPVGTIKWKVFNAKPRLAAVMGRKVEKAL